MTGGKDYPTLAQATCVWARIAALSFGGPAGQIAVMHRILVEEKRWLGDDRFLHALNFCMLLPGPEAQQLATYIGWLMHGVRGALVAGLLFIAPGVVAIMADKDLPGILEALAPVLDRVILTRNSSERSASLAALREAAAGLWDPESLLEADSVAEALEEAVVLSGSGRGGVVVTGSVVTAADARKATGHQDFGTIPSIATVGLEDPDDADESEGQQLLEEPEEDL